MKPRHKSKKSARPAVFLDRDGTILRERGYLSRADNLKIYPSAVKGLQLLKKKKLCLVLISNQSGVGRGYFSEQAVHDIHRELQRFLAAKRAKLDGIYFCPHLPSAGCPCRKPRTGLVMKAVRELGIDLKRSYVVGDQEGDMKLAKNIKAKAVLVLTGAGLGNRSRLRGLADKVSSNLSAAARWIGEDAFDA